MTESKNPQLLPAVAPAVILYIVLNLIEGFISLPFREASSFLSYLILKITGLEITLNGTLLSTARMTFDDIPACSGSTTLKVMVFSGTIWSFLQTKLSKRYRTFVALSCITVALLVNAVRLSTLVLIATIPVSRSRDCYTKSPGLSPSFCHLGLWSGSQKQ
ncbi:MAG: exosortase/archaeosortase family protein [Lentisphaerales bacterium]|nr:exosortase/archaeosortase family protein [Lentisphaerales bacterium]